MKKTVLYFSIVLMLIGSLFSFNASSEAKTNIKVLVDGKSINYDVSPTIKNGVTLVPIRKTVESLGLTVNWDKKRNTITTTGKGIKVSLTVGKKIAYKNGKAMSLSVPPTIINGRTLIPIRFLSEAYGFHVNWDAKQQMVLIFSSNQQEKIYKASHTKVPVLMYHILEKGKNDTLSTDPQRFKEHMTALKNAGYNTITIFDLQNFLEKGTSLPNNPILITFDDGYKSNYTEAYPVLKSLNMKATIFVIASRIFEERNIVGNEHEKFTWKDAREMKGTIDIQSHTWDSHRELPSISGKNVGMIASRLYLNGKLESQQEYEQRVFNDLIKSKEIIEEKLGNNVVSIAYPYGHYSSDTMNLAKKAGFKMAFTVKGGLVSPNDNPLQLNRITGNGAYSGKRLLQVIESY